MFPLIKITRIIPNLEQWLVAFRRRRYLYGVKFLFKLRSVVVNVLNLDDDSGGR